MSKKYKFTVYCYVEQVGIELAEAVEVILLAESSEIALKETKKLVKRPKYYVKKIEEVPQPQIKEEK